MVAARAESVGREPAANTRPYDIALPNVRLRNCWWKFRTRETFPLTGAD